MAAAKPEDLNTLKDYNKIKAELDGAINQFEYEMNRKNNLVHKFNKINKAFKGNAIPINRCCNKSTITFKSELDDYIKDCQTFIGEYDPTTKAALSAKSLVSSDIDPVAVIGQIWTTYKDLKDMQSKKVDGLVTLLNSIRLSSQKDLVKQ